MLQLCDLASVSPTRLAPTRRIEHPCVETLSLDPGHDLIGMRSVARFHHDFEFGPFGRHVKEHAPVRDFKDIRTQMPEQRGNAAEDARPVVDLDPQIDDTMFALQFAIDYGCEDARIDIAAAQDEADLALAEMCRVGE